MSQVFNLWWSSWKHHVTERACRRVHDVLSLLFRSTKTIKHLQLYNKNNHNYNPTTHNHLGPPIWSLPGPRWSSLDSDESHSIFQARPRFRYPTFSSFWDGFVGAFCNILMRLFWKSHYEKSEARPVDSPFWLPHSPPTTHPQPPTTKRLSKRVRKAIQQAQEECCFS